MKVRYTLIEFGVSRPEGPLDLHRGGDEGR